MNIKTNTTETITWEIEGCEATADIHNLEIKKLFIGMKANASSNYFNADDEQYIRDVYKVLGQLISHVDRRRGLGRDNSVDEKQPLYMMPEARLDLVAVDASDQLSKTVKGNMSSTTEEKEEF